jgi:RHS repeat-associated protein
VRKQGLAAAFLLLSAYLLAPLAEASLPRTSTPATEASVPAFVLPDPGRERSGFSLLEGDVQSGPTASAGERVPPVGGLRAPETAPLSPADFEYDSGPKSFRRYDPAGVLRGDGRFCENGVLSEYDAVGTSRHRLGPVVLAANAVALTAGPGTFRAGLGLCGLPFRSASRLGFLRGYAYDPRNASWLSEDPLGPVDSPNLYGYVGLRPHEKTDPLGLAEQTPEMKDQQCRVTGIGCTAHHDGGALVSFLGGAAEGGAVSGAALLVFSGMSLACGPAYGACFAGLTVGTLANVGVQNAASRIEAGQTAGQAAAGGAATAVGLAPGYAAVTNRDIVTQQDLGMTPEERARMGGQLAGAVAVGATVGPRLASKTAPKPAAAPAPKPAGARGVQVHQEVAAEYVARGGQDLGFGHATTDVNVGGPGTPEVSIVTVDLAGSSVSRSVPTGRTHPLTSKLTTKAWRSSVDPNVGPNRILHAELYGPEPPTPAQLRAIQAAQQEAASWADPVTIVFGYRK